MTTYLIALPGLLGILVALLTEVLTKAYAPAGLKSAVAGVLAILAGVIPTVTYDPRAPWTVYVIAVGAAWLTALGTHYTGVTQGLQTATAGVGLGPAPSAVPPLGSPMTAGGIVDTSATPPPTPPAAVQ